MALLALVGFAQSSKTYTYQLTVNSTTEPRPILNVHSVEYLKGYVGEASINSGLGSDDYQKIMYTIQHESGWYSSIDNGISKGLSQFTKETWLENCSNTDERDNPIKSIDCMVKLWKRGEQWRWDSFCYRYYNEKCITLRGLHPKNN